jgi:chromosome segregation ATPase
MGPPGYGFFRNQISSLAHSKKSTSNTAEFIEHIDSLRDLVISVQKNLQGDLASLKSDVRDLDMTVSDLKSDLNATRHEVMDLKSELRHEVIDLKSELNATRHEVIDLKSDLNATRHEVIEMGTKVDKLSVDFALFKGEQTEATLRLTIEKEYGREYAKPFIAQGLSSVVKLVVPEPPQLPRPINEASNSGEKSYFTKIKNGEDKL